MAMVQAVTHLYLAQLPVNFRVVFAKPIETQNDVLATKAHDCEHSMWLQYHRTVSHTSEMLPALFSIPSTLYTGMGQLSFFIVRLFRCTKLELMKRLVMPQSRRPFVDRTMPVSVRTEVLLLGPQGQRWPRAGVTKGGLDQKGSVHPTEVIEYEIP